MINRLFMIIAVGASSCMMRPKQESVSGQMLEKHRPQFHFSPAANWTNDPNGLVWANGEYHLFYQHNPDKPVWGPMHWGHAVSKDLIHWEQLPIALYPDSLGHIFSGSAVVDIDNTSGLGNHDNSPIILIFTYHNMSAEHAGRNDYQSQGLAYSNDNGRTWIKYKSNPIIENPGEIRDFRDPKVIWDNPRKQWVMTLAVNDHVEFYVSPNLIDWRKTGEFGQTAGAHGGVWECPDLIRAIADNGEEKYILLVSINPGAPNGGSGTQYFIGDFDGQKFTNGDVKENAGWIDYGTDNYAGVTFANVPDGRTILIGWMSNWTYAQTVPTTAWRNAMTIPREIKLTEVDGRYVVTSNPVAEFQKLRGKKLNLDKVLGTITSVPNSIDLPSGKIELLIDVDRSALGKSFAISFLNDMGEELVIGVDSMNRLYINRMKSGDVGFDKTFGAIHYAPRISRDQLVKLRILLDTSSIEVFADDGSVAMTDIIFPTEPYKKVEISSPQNGVEIVNATAFSLNSIWE